MKFKLIHLIIWYALIKISTAIEAGTFVVAYVTGLEVLSDYENLMEHRGTVQTICNWTRAKREIAQELTAQRESAEWESLCHSLDQKLQVAYESSAATLKQIIVDDKVLPKFSPHSPGLENIFQSIIKFLSYKSCDEFHGEIQYDKLKGIKLLEAVNWTDVNYHKDIAKRQHDLRHGPPLSFSEWFEKNRLLENGKHPDMNKLSIVEKRFEAEADLMINFYNSLKVPYKVLSEEPLQRSILGVLINKARNIIPPQLELGHTIENTLQIENGILILKFKIPLKCDPEFMWPTLSWIMIIIMLTFFIFRCIRCCFNAVKTNTDSDNDSVESQKV